GDGEVDGEVIGIGVAGRVLATDDVAVGAVVDQAGHDSALRQAAGGRERRGKRSVGGTRHGAVSARGVFVGREAEGGLRRAGGEGPGGRARAPHRRRRVGPATGEGRHVGLDFGGGEGGIVDVDLV